MPDQSNRAEVSETPKTLQGQLYSETRYCGWDPGKVNTLPEELMHIAAEVAEAFEAWRLTGDCRIWYRDDGQPEGVPIEFADVLIGLFYNAEIHGFDLMEALEIKRRWNLSRDYLAEGRQLHA